MAIAFNRVEHRFEFTALVYDTANEAFMADAVGVFDQKYNYFQAVNTESTVLATRRGNDIVHGSPGYKFPNSDVEWGIGDLFISELANHSVSQIGDFLVEGTFIYPSPMGDSSLPISPTTGEGWIRYSTLGDGKGADKSSPHVVQVFPAFEPARSIFQPAMDAYVDENGKLQHFYESSNDLRLQLSSNGGEATTKIIAEVDLSDLLDVLGSTDIVESVKLQLDYRVAALVQEGVTIYVDANGNRLLDRNEMSTTTGNDGEYSFFGLAVGDHSIRLVSPPRTTLTFPGPGRGHLVAISPRQMTSEANFGITRSIDAGVFFADVSGNGDIDFGNFLILSANFGKEDASWVDGDFDENGVVAFSDFLILSSRFGDQEVIWA